MLVAAQLCSRAGRGLGFARWRLLTATLGRRERVIRQWRVTQIVIANGDNGRCGRSDRDAVVTRLATAVVLLLLAVSLGTAGAQPPEKMPRVGYLNPGSFSDPVRQRRLEALRQGLRELGYVEGQNIALEPRWAEGKLDRYPALAADLVRSQVDVIVAWSGAATKAAQEATRTIPIVMSLVNDPVGSGLVASLARPGGNVTGTTARAPKGRWVKSSPRFGQRPCARRHSRQQLETRPEFPSPAVIRRSLCRNSLILKRATEAARKHGFEA
jgi:hypothetical protein